MNKTIRFKLNGQPESLTVNRKHSLLWVTMRSNADTAPQT